jgi:hypothetical protein
MVGEHLYGAPEKQNGTAVPTRSGQAPALPYHENALDK